MKASSKKAIFRISTAASMLQLHPRTLRNYERAGLVKPIRRGKWRYYSGDDIAWIKCLYSMIHKKGINIASIGRLLGYAPCWEVAECPAEKRLDCARYQAQTMTESEVNGVKRKEMLTTGASGKPQKIIVRQNSAVAESRREI